MPQTTNEPSKSENVVNRPVHTIRYGALRAAIWKREVDLGNNSRPMYSVTLTRSYKDGNDWKDSSSFGPDDLLTLAKIADDAHTFIHQNRLKDAATERQRSQDAQESATPART
jgi:hypothetical protein